MALVIAIGKWATANIIPMIIGNQLPDIPAKMTNKNPMDNITESPIILFNGLLLKVAVEFMAVF